MEKVRALLAVHDPSRADAAVVPLGEGLQFCAYEVDGLVVRIAKDPAAPVEREARLLAEVARVAPVPVPEPVFVDERAGCIAHRKLPGVALLDVPAERRLAAGGAVLGELLRALHGAPALAELVHVDNDPPSMWLAEAAGLYRAAAGSFDQRSKAAVEGFLGAPPPAGADGVFSHNDLGAEHVLVDPGSLAVTGVIDWSDAAVCDPAYDFGLLLRDLGPGALEAALGAYGSVDEELRERALFYARCALLEDLAYGLESGRREYVDKSLLALDWLFPA